MQISFGHICLGILVLSLQNTRAYSETIACGELELMKGRSRGVQILTNTCQRGGEIASGTILRLAPGARLWLAATKDKQQVVCQSRAKTHLALLVDQPRPPWISSMALRNCRQQKNRWHCLGHKDDDEILTCAMTRLQQPATGPSSPQEATSLVLRSPQPAGGQTTEEDASGRQTLAELKQEARLCHELYGIEQKFHLTWTITPQGEVNPIDTPQPLQQLHPRLFSCLEDLIRSHAYPPTSKPMTLSAPL